MKTNDSTTRRHLGRAGRMAIAAFSAIALAILAFVVASHGFQHGSSETRNGGAKSSSMSSGSAQILNGATIHTSSDLADFLTNAAFNAPQNDSGQYVVTPGSSYTFRLSFQERYGDDTLQFPDRSTMTYGIPEGLEIANGHSGTFTIRIKDGTETYLVQDNSYSIQDGILRVNFNADDPNFGKLTATANVRFTLEFQGSLSEDSDKVMFSSGISKDLLVDKTNSVTASKSATFDKAHNRVEYSVTLHSLGKSTDVHVRDALTGDALTLDATSISATSSTGRPVTMTGGVQGNGFDYLIPSMENNEFVTFSYFADIDPLAVPSINGRYVTVGHNEVEAWSLGDPTPDKREVNTTIDYTPTIEKSNGLITAENGNVKTMAWTIEANRLPQVTMAGTTITDTIAPASQGIMRYSGNGLTVVVRDAAGNTVRTDHVAWGQLANKTDSTWTYVVPPSDANSAYSYTIGYTTDVDLSGQVSATTVNNGVTTSSGMSSSGSGQGIPTGGEVLVHKETKDIDLANGEVTWDISFNVPSDGLATAEVSDTYPRVYDADGTCYRDPVKEGSVTVAGLVDGETYSVTYGATDARIVFYQDADGTQAGLRAAGERTVTVTLKTLLNQDWLEASKDYNNDPGRGNFPKHNNYVTLNANGVPKTALATAVITLPDVMKSSTPICTRVVDGIELPVYRYEVVVTGVDSDNLTIEDRFDTDLLMYYDASEYNDPGDIYGGNINWQANKGGKFNRLDTVDGMVISTDASSLPHTAQGGYYDAYRFVYYLTVKDAAALNTIKERAAASDDGTYAIGNIAKFRDSTDGADITYEYDGLTKEILTPDDELKKVDEDIWADFRITLNGGGLLLNGGEDLVMTDTVENLSVDINSIRATPSSGVSWDMTGNTVTYVIPDGVPVTITYRARVVMSSLGDVGETQHINFSNHAEMKCYREDIDKVAERTNNGEGDGSIPSIGLLKYRAGDMTQTLAGARFQLQDASEQPVLDKDGNPVEFTTGADGKIVIKGDMERLGWAVKENTRYYLEEKLAPKGFMLAGHKYQFTVSDDGTSDYGRYLYYSGDTMTVKDYLGTDVRVHKAWSDGNGKHADDTVVVRLQQSTDGQSWSDTIRRRDADDQWSDDTDVDVTLGASNGWEGLFRQLPLAVPRDLSNPEGDDIDVSYRVVEISVNGESLPEVVLGTGGQAEDTGTYVYTIENKVADGQLEVRKTVQSDKAADREREFEFVVTMKGTDGATDTSVDGPHGDMSFDAGIARIRLRDGATKTATGLPLGATYVVTETPVDGFVTAVGQELTNETGGTVSATKSVAAFTNTREEAETGGLVVEKVVSSHTASDREAKYDFVVTLDDKTIEGQYGKMSFDGGEARFSLTDKDVLDGNGKSTGIRTAEGLPAGIGYTVSEETDGFTVTSKGATGKIGVLPVPEGAPDGTEPTYPIATFTNTRNEGALTLSKTVTGITSANTGRKYHFAITLRNEDGSEASFVNDEHDGVAFDHGRAIVEITGAGTKTIGGLPQGLRYEVTEVTLDSEGNATPGAPAGFEAHYINQNGTIAAGNASVTIANAYHAGGNIELDAKKVLAGRPFAPGDEWVFSLRASEGAPLPKDARGHDVTEVRIAPTEGNETPVKFGTIGYDVDDLGTDGTATFTYTITEATGKDADGRDKVTDVINDHAKTVTVKVSDNGDGTLDVKKTVDGTEITADRPLAFTNSYQVKETLQVAKRLVGRRWRDGSDGTRRDKYGFEIVATGESLIKMSHSLVNARAYTDSETQPATFGELAFTPADIGKTYSYAIREIVPDDAVNPDGVAYGATSLVTGRHGPWTKDGITYSEQQYEVRFAVSTDADGRLRVDRLCTPAADDGITFTNTYSAREATQVIVATKDLRGGTLAAGDFQFRLHDVKRNKDYVAGNGLVSDANGMPVAGESANAIMFDRIDAFEAAGDYEFTLSEVIPEGAAPQADGTFVLDGITYDPTQWTVTISVTDDMLGHLVASAPTYKVAGSEAIAGASAPQFVNSRFAAKASIGFGKYFYGKDQNARFGFTLEAAEGEGFVPRQHKPGDDIILDAAAYGEDNPLVDRGEAFGLSLANAAPFDANGHATVAVPEITYHAPGTYRYVITEDECDPAISGDAAELLVTVVVNPDATVQPPAYAIRIDGEVAPIDAREADFYNNDLVSMSFRARALRVASSDEADRMARYMPKVRKVMAGGTLKGDDFSFTLRDKDGALLSTATNDANGTVAFGILPYGSDDAGKTYTYTIAEVPGTDAAIKYDTHPITLKVKVTEAEGGALAVEGNYYLTDAVTGTLVKVDDPVIVNAYDTIVIHAVKRTREFNEDGTINNAAEGLPGAHYGLWMVNPGGEDIYMGLGRDRVDEEGSKLESDQNGNLYYDIPMLQGVAYYFLEEAPAPEGHLVDPYPTDYFTLVHDESGFRLVYEHDGPDANGKVFSDYVTEL